MNECIFHLEYNVPSVDKELKLSVLISILVAAKDPTADEVPKLKVIWDLICVLIGVPDFLERPPLFLPNDFLRAIYVDEKNSYT